MMILCGVLPQPHTVRSALKDGDSLMQGVLAFSPVRWSGFMISGGRKAGAQQTGAERFGDLEAIQGQRSVNT